jgi:hypothetical protein
LPIGSALERSRDFETVVVCKPDVKNQVYLVLRRVHGRVRCHSRHRCKDIAGPGDAAAPDVGFS